MQPSDLGSYQPRNLSIDRTAVFVEKPFLATPPDWGIDEHFYISGELLTYYWDWEIVKFEETIFDCNSGGVPHKHAMDVMIARHR